MNFAFTLLERNSKIMGPLRTVSYKCCVEWMKWNRLQRAKIVVIQALHSVAANEREEYHFSLNIVMCGRQYKLPNVRVRSQNVHT